VSYLLSSTCEKFLSASAVSPDRNRQVNHLHLFSELHGRTGGVRALAFCASVTMWVRRSRLALAHGQSLFEGAEAVNNVPNLEAVRKGS
jgi:hypothetical protein